MSILNQASSTAPIKAKKLYIYVLIILQQIKVFVALQFNAVVGGFSACCRSLSFVATPPPFPFFFCLFSKFNFAGEDFWFVHTGKKFGSKRCSLGFWLHTSDNFISPGRLWLSIGFSLPLLRVLPETNSCFGFTSVFFSWLGTSCLRTSDVSKDNEHTVGSYEGGVIGLRMLPKEWMAPYIQR